MTRGTGLSPGTPRSGRVTPAGGFEMPTIVVRRWAASAVLAAALASAACRQAAPGTLHPAAAPPDTSAVQDVVVEGRAVFHGQGLCYACHGGRLQGGPVAPPLAGPGRNPADTSFAYVLHIIQGGSPHTPMVANQGGIGAGQIVQVANYVWAVSNGKAVP